MATVGRVGRGVIALTPGGDWSIDRFYEMQPKVGIESSHLSQQLAVLRRAGVVLSRKDGSSVIYALRDPAVAELLAVAKRFLRSSLTETRSLLADLGR